MLDSNDNQPTPDPEAQKAAQQAQAAELGRAEPELHAFVAQLALAARKMKDECAKRLGQAENGDISRAKEFLHEAGQWLEKAALNLKSAGI